MISVTKPDFKSVRILLLAIFVAAGCCALRAQSDQPLSPQPGQMGQPAPNAERELAQLTEALSLTPDQQTQIKAILRERQEKVEALRASGIQPTREQLVAVRKDTDTKISALLNDDQKAKFAVFQKQRSSRRRGGGGDGTSPSPTPPPSA
jgi:Spy/CpxP family protein refolding chaperone